MKRIEIVGALAGLASDVANGMGPLDLAQRLRALATVAEGVVGRPGSAQDEPRAPLALADGRAPGVALAKAPDGPMVPAGTSCPECGKPQLRCPGGWTCPEGHGFGEPGAGVDDREQRMRAAVDRLFAFWVQVTGRSPVSTKKTKERAAALRSRLRDGYTEADIRRAIANVAASSYHQGDNKSGTKYDDLTLICRNGSHVEKYRDLGDEDPGVEAVAAAEGSYDEQRERRRAKLKKQIAKAMKEGRKDEYEKLQDKLRALDASA